MLTAESGGWALGNEVRVQYGNGGGLVSAGDLGAAEQARWWTWPPHGFAAGAHGRDSCGVCRQRLDLWAGVRLWLASSPHLVVTAWAGQSWWVTPRPGSFPQPDGGGSSTLKDVFLPGARSQGLVLTKQGKFMGAILCLCSRLPRCRGGTGAPWGVVTFEERTRLGLEGRGVPCTGWCVRLSAEGLQGEPPPGRRRLGDGY